MLTYHVNDHSYFVSEVEITIEPNEKYNYTSCEIRFTPNGREDGISSPFVWWVDADGFFDNAKDALEELTQDKYQCRGSSESW